VISGGLPNCQLQIDSFSIANPNLTSEQSTQFGFGVVYDPFDWLDLSLDYYNIEIEDSISQYSAQDIVDCTRDPAQFGACPSGLGAVLRLDGSIRSLTTGFANRGLLQTDGLDFRLGTDFDLGGMGKLSNQLTVSYIRSLEISDITGRMVEQTNLGGAPDTRANLYNTWEYGDFSVAFNTNYLGSHGNYGGYATNDLQFSYKTPWNARVSIGATNVGDRYPELIPYDGRPWNFYLYDAYGRTTYFRYVQTF